MRSVRAQNLKVLKALEAPVVYKGKGAVEAEREPRRQPTLETGLPALNL